VPRPTRAPAPALLPTAPAAPERLYTVDAANRTLPFVRRVAEDLVRDYARWRARVRAVEVAGGPGARTALPSDTARRLQRETRQLAADIQTSLGELALLGVRCTSLEEGLVDFPATVDGAPAYLCWRPGEDAVAWWHPRDAGFAGRRPLDGARVDADAAAHAEGDA
jgi:hypothetical protein